MILKRSKTNIIIALAVLLLIRSDLVMGQGGLSITGGIEFDGINWGYQFQQNGSVLVSKNLIRETSGSSRAGFGFAPQFNLGIKYRFSKLFALEMGTGISELDFMVYDSYFLSRYAIPVTPSSNMSNVRAVDGNFDFVKWYYSGYISSYFFLDKGGPIVPYLNLGLKYYFLPPGPEDLTGYYKYEPTNEDLTMTARYTQSFVGAFAEMGLSFGRPEKKLKWLIGCRYNHSGTIMWGDYKNTTDDQVNYSDKASATGSSMGLVVRVSGLLVPSKTNIYIKRSKQRNTKTRSKRKAAKTPKQPVQQKKPNSLNNH